MTRRLLLTFAALVLVLAGCGDDDDTDAAAQDTSTTAAAPDESTTTAADSGSDDPYGGGGSATDDGSDGVTGMAVAISDFTFDPGTIEVSAGDTVTWTNDDGVDHTVTAGTPDAPADTFDESVDAGGDAEVTFDEAGTFPYFCAIHPTMTGEVVVS